MRPRQLPGLPEHAAQQKMMPDTHRWMRALHCGSCRASKSWGHCSQCPASSLRLVASSRMMRPKAKTSVSRVYWGGAPEPFCPALQLDGWAHAVCSYIPDHEPVDCCAQLPCPLMPGQFPASAQQGSELRGGAWCCEGLSELAAEGQGSGFRAWHA